MEQNNDMQRTRSGSALRILGRRGIAASAVMLLAAAGCEVSNPGKVNDEFVETAPESFVNGSMRRLTEVVGNEAYTLALAGREIFPGGQTGSYGHSVRNQAGAFEWDDSGPYNDAQQARWIAEEAVRRFSEGDEEVPDEVWFQAYNWAGYANRWLGELYCEAVIDGGALQPNTVYFERAEEHFTNALTYATTTDEQNAALAGRAQVRAQLGDWAGVATDAAAVGDDWNFYLQMDFSQGGDVDVRNHLYWAQASIPYRSYSIIHTFFEDYYTNTHDPRTPWAPYETAEFCNASLQGYGNVECLQQKKYLSEDDDIRLAGSDEMRLLQAEAILVQTPGDFATAGALINGVRTSHLRDDTGVALDPWPVSTLEETWTALFRERNIEMWLEGRRYIDERRWANQAADRPAGVDPEVPDFEAQSTVFASYPRGRPLTADAPDTAPRVMCYAISETEREQNPNVPLIGQEP